MLDSRVVLSCCTLVCVSSGKYLLSAPLPPLDLPRSCFAKFVQAMTEPRRSDTSPQYRAVASGMNLSLDVSHRSASPLRSPPVHVGGTSSQPYFSPPGSGGARLTPKPVAIDMPSPASFDPLLEHFLRAVDSSEGTCVCLFQRADGGKLLRLALEQGNVPLMSAERG